MSYFPSKTRATKYDKASVEFRKELELLAKKSKGEYESLKIQEKNEFLSNKGLAVRIASPRRKQQFITEEKAKSSIQSNRNDQKTRVTRQSPPEMKESTNKKMALKKSEDLKTKPRLHEPGVVSIRPDNPDLKVIMQGKKIEKKSPDVDFDDSTEKRKVMK